MQRDAQGLLGKTSRGDPIVVVVLRCVSIGVSMFDGRRRSVQGYWNDDVVAEKMDREEREER